MRSRIRIFIFIGLLLSGFCLYHLRDSSKQASYSLPRGNQLAIAEVKPSFRGEGEDPQERAHFNFTRLRDPISGTIPPRMRERELEFANQLRRLEKARAPRQLAASWEARGPVNVGGRTRGLAIDFDFNGSSNRRILAGGVSGGIFISDDNGANWRLVTSPSQFASVTCLAQDPNNRNVWYHGTGEFFNSIRGANYLGQGIFKSTDQGETWEQVASTVQGSSPNRFDNPFDFVWNLAISPQTGTLYAAAVATIMRSMDGGTTWQAAIVGQDEQGALSLLTDVAIASDGTVYATLSRNGAALPVGGFGVFRSDNDGVNFANISPPELSQDPYRMVLATAPSDPATVYLLVQATPAGKTAGDHQLFRYNANANAWTNLTANIPNPPGPVGTFDSQGGYDLLIKVKPDDPEVVWIGGTNLHRSTNGGQTFDLVGGYLAPQIIALYENHHPDQHSMTFYPGNPNAGISGHDGGLSMSSNLMEQPQTWTRINNGYTTTQFYAVAIDPRPGNDAVIIGGTQDNGTWATESTNEQEPWFELFGGDGAFTAIAPGGFPFYISSQSGNIVRGTVENNQLIYSAVAPAGAQDFLFIAPYLLDPNDPRVMYVAGGNTVWRNSNLDEIPVGNANPTATNWTILDNSAVPNTSVTALAVTTTPANRLYFGATSNSMTVLRRVDTAQNNPSGSSITPPGIVAGSYTSSIAVNPANGNELLVTYSNFNVPSLWHSTDGGLTWTDVEGSLAGEDGPSIRWAVISPTGEYLVATSIGVFSTSNLSAGNTNWIQEGGETIGNVVVDMLTLRHEDGFLVAGTHGRGVYSARLSQGGSAIARADKSSLQVEVDVDQTASASFTLSNDGDANLNYSIGAAANFPGSTTQRNGRYVATLMELAPVGTNPWLRLKAEPNRREKHAHASAAIPQGLTSMKTMNPNQRDDIIILDDGNDSADDFIGFNDGSTDFYWLNAIDLEFNYRLKGFRFFMRTESAFSNPTFVAVLDNDGNALVEGNIEFAVAPNGDWFQVNLNSPLTFQTGERFQVLVGASRDIGFPAGADVDGRTTRRSWFFDPDVGEFVRLETIQAFENGAFLMRPFGDILESENLPPVAQAQLSATTAQVGERLTFDASGSSDPDGQIASVLWNFGDGDLSTNIVATHAYLSAGTFDYTLTVTDDLGATDDLSGQISVSAAPSRLTVEPNSGILAPGNSQLITVNLDAQDLPSGIYQGEIRITGNGGIFVLPLTLNVGSIVGVETSELLPGKFSLEQNYPNPFNPETVIGYTLPERKRVRIVIYNTLGQEIRVLADELKPAGAHSTRWDGTDGQGHRAPSGVYIYRIESSGFTQARKMMLLQ